MGYNQKFWDANAICSSWNAALASVHSAAENKFILGKLTLEPALFHFTLIELTKTGEPKAAWTGQVSIGMYYDGENWKWTDGSSIDYSNFAFGQPDHDGGQLTCVVTIPDKQLNTGISPLAIGQWNDFPCSAVMRAFVCKKPAFFL